MTEIDAAGLIRDGMLVTLKLGGPPLLVALIVGLLVSLMQAITQINEASLAFVPKILGISATMLLLGSYMVSTLSAYTRLLLDRVIAAGGS